MPCSYRWEEDYLTLPALMKSLFFSLSLCPGHSFFLHSSEFLSCCQLHNLEGRPQGGKNPRHPLCVNMCNYVRRRAPSLFVTPSSWSLEAKGEKMNYKRRHRRFMTLNIHTLCLVQALATTVICLAL